MTAAPPAATAPAEQPAERWPAIAIALLALAASVSGLVNGFTYDDRSIVLQNGRVHHLGHLGRLWIETYWPPSMGAGLYRPVTTSAFTLEWALGRGAPWVFHAVNVALYVLVCVAVYALAVLVLPRLAAWVSAALFAVHPVHVEAVGNIVGQSELWAAAGVVGTVVLYVRWRRRALAAPPGAGPWAAMGGGWRAVVLTALVVGACLAKEHAIVVPALIAAAELWVVGDPRPLGVRWRALRPLALLLVAVLLAYVVVRAQVIGAWTGDRSNVVFEHLTPAGRRWTMLGVVPAWARLLFWPARLAAEYSPPDIGIYQRFGLDLLPGAALLVAAGSLLLASARRWAVGAFALTWLAVTLLLVSNVVVPTGIVLAERTLLLPSVGAMLLVGAVLARLGAYAGEPGRVTASRRRALRLGARVVLAAILIVTAARSATRQLVWRSNATLFTQGVIDNPLSYRAHDVYAGLLFERGDRAAGEREARIALALYPHDAVLYRDLANEYVRANLCGPAVPLLQRAIAEATLPTDAHVLLAECMLVQGDPVSARAELLHAMSQSDYGPIYHQVLLSVDSALARRRAAATPPAGARAGAL